MALEPWDVDLLSKTAISEAGMPETDAEWRTWEEAQRALGKHVGENAEGHSEYDPEVWMMGRHAPSHEKYYKPEQSSGHYYMPGVTDPEDDDDEVRDPVNYHVMTGHVDSTDPSEWTEHEYTMFEHPDSDYDTDGAWDYFQQDNPQYNPERNINATHEVKNVHPAEHHDDFHRSLANEEAIFQRVAPHGFQRESPSVLAHKAYRYEEPGGVVHRLWHIDHSANGPGWHTSRYDPALSRENQPTPWTEHLDSESEDSLGDALAQFEQNRRMA